VPGKRPAATFKDQHGNPIKDEELPDLGASELATWLQERGFQLKMRTEVYGAEPISSVTFQGRKYDFYSERNLRATAAEFASSRGGNLLTLETSDESAFVFKTLQGLPDGGPAGVWLAASDASQEGEWVWEAGSLANKKFWSGNHLNGTQVDGLHSAWNWGEPNNANGVSPENCAVAIVQGSEFKWNDVPCGAQKAALVIEFGQGTHQEL